MTGKFPCADEQCRSVGGMVDTKNAVQLKIGCSPGPQYADAHPCKQCGLVHWAHGESIMAPWLDKMKLYWLDDALYARIGPATAASVAAHAKCLGNSMLCIYEGDVYAFVEEAKMLTKNEPVPKNEYIH